MRTELSLQINARALRPREDIMGEYDHAFGLRMLVPKWYLYGTQNKDEYNHKSGDWVRERFKTKQGRFEMLKSPEIVVAVPEDTGLMLFIADGHHRSRYCSNETVPSLIFTERYARSIANVFNKNNGYEPLNESEFREHLYESATSALRSFSRTLPENKYPRPVIGVSSIHDLKNVRGFKPY